MIKRFFRAHNRGEESRESVLRIHFTLILDFLEHLRLAESGFRGYVCAILFIVKQKGYDMWPHICISLFILKRDV